MYSRCVIRAYTLQQASIKFVENRVLTGLHLYTPKSAPEYQYKGTAMHVDISHYEIYDLEACWSDIMIDGMRAVIGSIYMWENCKTLQELFESVLENVLETKKMWYYV